MPVVSPPRRIPRTVAEVKIAWSEWTSGYFTIGSSTIGGPDVLAPALFSQSFEGDFDDVTDDVDSLQARRGRSSSLQTMQGGEASLTLTDPTGKYNVENPDSPLAPWLPNTLRPTRIRVRGPAPLLVAMSGYEITDVVRRYGHEGDGRLPESTTGVYRPSTNHALNSTFQGGDTTGWAPAETASISATRAFARFGDWSLRVDSLDVDGAFVETGGILAATEYVYGLWILDPAGGDYVVSLTDQIDQMMETPTVTVPAGVWTYVGTTGTTDAHTTRFLAVYSLDPGPRTFYVDGAQVEEGELRTPLIGTYGLPRSRGAATPTVPVPFNGLQGWVSVRFRVGFPSTVATPNVNGSPPHVFSTGLYDDEWLGCFWDGAAFVLERRSGAISETVDDTLAFVAGDEITVTCSWEADRLRVAARVSGEASAGPQTNASVSLAPVDMAGLAVGHAGGTGELHGDVFWTLAGTGALPAGAFAFMETLPNVDPDLSLFA